MAEQTPRTLNHFSLFSFTDAYWMMNEHAKASFHKHWLEGLTATATNFDIYQNTDARADLLLWCAVDASQPTAAATFFEKLATVTTPYRHVIRPVESLWGFTRPSQDTNARSAQEIDPFSTTRMHYLVVCPFTKTPDAYLMSRESRQGMIDEHFRIEKQPEETKQLPLYSFGLQSYEFMVIYETDDLLRFSGPANELRATEAQRYTERDTPVYTAVYHPAQQTMGLWT